MTWAWSTTPDGHVEVDEDGSGAYQALSLPGPDAATTRTEQWAALAQQYATQNNIPLSWVLAVIYSESGGDPMAGSTSDVGAGLMQLTLTIYKLTRAQAQDPETSIRLGAQTLGNLHAKGYDLPAVASAFNAGDGPSGPHTAASDPWGYLETRPSLPYTGYIEKVVRASNYWLDHPPSVAVTPGAATGPSTASKAVALVLGAGIAYYLTRELL